MSAQNDGGPAFPAHHSTVRNGNRITFLSDGMSLRDWFAGQALAWCLAEFAGNAEDMKQPAEAAYQIADAMLRARNKSEAPEASSRSGASANAYTGVVLSRNWGGAQ